MNNDQECADYLLSKDLSRFMKELRKKWESYGKFTGRISLVNPTETERKDLKGILGNDFSSDGKLSVPAREFEAALQSTRFAPVDMKAVCEFYFGSSLVTNKERKEGEKQEYVTFRNSIHALLNQENAKASLHAWIEHMFDKREYGYKVLLKLKKDGRVQSVFVPVVRGVCELLKKDEFPVPIAVFSSKISGNPHFLDRGKEGAQLLVSFLSFREGRELPKGSEQWYALMESVGLLKDEIAGSVACFNVHLYTDGKRYAPSEACYALGQPMLISFANLRGIQMAETETHDVYIVENEMIFSYLQHALQNTSVALLCTSGQLSTTANYLLSLLANSHVKMYYSGDMDLEGIGICDRLWQKYPDNLIPWHMSPEDYLKSLSEEEIHMSRVTDIKNVELKKTQEMVLQVKKAGYQENILDIYMQDLSADKKS